MISSLSIIISQNKMKRTSFSTLALLLGLAVTISADTSAYRGKDADFWDPESTGVVDEFGNDWGADASNDNYWYTDSHGV